MRFLCVCSHPVSHALVKWRVSVVTSVAVSTELLCCWTTMVIPLRCGKVSSISAILDLTIRSSLILMGSVYGFRVESSSLKRNNVIIRIVDLVFYEVLFLLRKRMRKLILKLILEMNTFFQIVLICLLLFQN